MTAFGWSLPPGCGTLPGEEDDPMDNTIVEKAFSDYESPYEVYRTTYKYTDCGPSIGFCFHYWVEVPPDGFNEWGGEKEETKWFYCDSLHKLGTWKELAERGWLCLAVSVSSIVEGVDQCTDTIEVPLNPDDLINLEIEADENDLSRTVNRLFYAAVDEVNKEADAIWQATHGCETCAKHWAGNPDDWNEDDWQIGETNVWTECPDCGGSGTVF